MWTGGAGDQTPNPAINGRATTATCSAVSTSFVSLSTFHIVGVIDQIKSN